MPKNANLEVFQIASTKVDEVEVQRWLTHLEANNFEIPPEDVVSNPAMLIALAAKRCYMSFEAGLNPNVTRVRGDYAKYFDNVLASGHGSVLEHSVFTFAIEGVSRVFTAEMNRHRAGWAISEGSMRFIRFNKDIPYWIPDSIQNHESDSDDLRRRKEQTRDVFLNAFTHTEQLYGKLLEIWDMNETDKDFAYKKKVTSCLRRIVPMGVATGGVWSGNVRALRHVLTMRCAPAAEEEICHVFSKVASEMSKNHPLLFGDFYQDEYGYWRPKFVKV